MTYFGEVKKNFGFGCMRFPMKDGEVNKTELCKMIDAFIAAGFNYFDTAHGYLRGKSEVAVRECLTSRYPRDAYLLADKLTSSYFSCEADIRPFFESQLDICGVEYFDFYLMHAQNKEFFEKYKACRAYETAFALKEEGKIRHVGLSFHDRAEVLDEILTTYPEVEFVQLQINYLDWDDPVVQSRLCYEVCRRHGKPVIVMEPVKGGTLVDLPVGAKEILAGLGGGSTASYAMRFAAGHEGVFMVLSGMSNSEQMNDNISYMQDFQPLSEEELNAVKNVCSILKSKNLIPCTACRYCTDGCPKHILIPDAFSCLNAKQSEHDWNSAVYYNNICIKNGGKASDCIGCGKCEKVCPQHLPIRELLKKVAASFEK